jgi:hypothetical protein
VGAASSYTLDANWYLDTGATYHMTGELEKLVVQERYKGKDQIHGVDGSGMVINHVGYSLIMFFMFQKRIKTLFLSIV